MFWDPKLVLRGGLDIRQISRLHRTHIPSACLLVSPIEGEQHCLPGYSIFPITMYSPHFDSFQLIPFFFYIHIPNFLYSPYLIPFILFPIHFYSSSDPLYSKLTPHSTPYLGLAEARSTIPKSSNWWDSESKTRRSQDWMHQFKAYLGHTESHDRGEDVGSDGKGRRRSYGAVFPFPSFLISFQYYFSIFSMVFPSFY